MASVFVCFRLVDQAEVEKLAVELKARGHQVWFSHWEIAVGDSIVGKINEGLSGAANVLACFSAACWSSPWMAREWMSSLARQLQGDNVRLISVLLPGGAPPAILADVRYADLSQNWADGVNELCAALQ